MQVQAMQRESGWTNGARQYLMLYEKLSAGRNPASGCAMAGEAAMTKASKAPGGPGSTSTWTTSAKDMVTTALGNSRVWVTLGYGIVNEIYWPATGTPQIRDLGFIYALSLADYWNERVEDWIYVVGGAFAARFGVSGYYVRIGPSPAQGGLRGRVTLANRGGESAPADTIVGMEFLHLVRLGLRAGSDPRIQDTCRVTDALLRVETPNGVAYHRYNDDGYGEYADSRPFDGSGIGRAWPLLTGEPVISRCSVAVTRCPISRR
jgi:GH15 family glucan-1,4-alpha-glucosidase